MEDFHYCTILTLEEAGFIFKLSIAFVTILFQGLFGILTQAVCVIVACKCTVPDTLCVINVQSIT